MSKLIACRICFEETHAISLHLKKAHVGYSLDSYRRDFPDAPLLSQQAEDAIRKKKDTERTNMATSNVQKIKIPGDEPSNFLHKVFRLGEVDSAKAPSGRPIQIDVLPKHDYQDIVPDADPNQIWDIEYLKNCLMGIELNVPVYAWGHAGTGKTTAFEQIAHYTNRPCMRVQHTANMMESDVTGQWGAKNGETVFQLGPLAMAMKHGWMYLADEYDYAFPSVLAVYQPVLEGKPLIIKEADIENRIIRPHKNFRFVATGNTNGTGDESGLYRGTLLQNAANYSRFGICVKREYLEENAERRMVEKQANVIKDDAERLVKFANDIRTAFENKKIGSTIGPRELIFAGLIGSRKGSIRAGVELSWINKLSGIDRMAADKVAQRRFG